jgi:hypothetical protein
MTDIPSPEQWLSEQGIFGRSCPTCRHPGRAQIDAAHGRVSQLHLARWTEEFAERLGAPPLKVGQIEGHFRRGHDRSAS